MASTALPQRYRVLIALLGSAILAYAAFVSAKRGLADWSSMQARHEVVTWTEHRTIPPPARLQEAINSLINALARAPNDPILIEHLGAALQLRANAAAPGSQLRQLALRAALVYFRKAAALRPSSPYTWANILLVKYHLGQIDDEFFDTIRNALDLGPWEPAVQLIVADATLGTWNGLDAGLRTRATENLRRAAVRQTAALARIATDQRRVDLICAAAFEEMKSKLKCLR